MLNKSFFSDRNRLDQIYGQVYLIRNGPDISTKFWTGLGLQKSPICSKLVGNIHTRDERSHILKTPTPLLLHALRLLLLLQKILKHQP